jgi:hypothetical protein
MSFTDVLKKSFPFISAAASLGGPVGTIAASLVGKALGVDRVPATSDGISNAIATAFADPAQRAALIQAEQQFQAQMAELGYKDAEALAATAESDRASARQREIQVRDWMPRLLGTGIVSGFIVAVFLILSGHAKADSVLAGTLVGYLSAKSELVLSYYFGSSSGSDRKTELLAQAPPIPK